MSLQKLVDEIEGESSAASQRLLGEARAEEKKILDAARAEGSALLSKTRAAAKEEARRNSVEALASARLQAKRTEGIAREAAVQRVFDGLREQLRVFAQKKEYERVFARLVAEGAKEIGRDFVLKANSRDAALARKHGKLGETIDCIGGVVVASADGTIQANNTFDALLEEHAEEIKREAFAELFGVKRKK